MNVSSAHSPLQQSECLVLLFAIPTPSLSPPSQTQFCLVDHVCKRVEELIVLCDDVVIVVVVVGGGDWCGCLMNFIMYCESNKIGCQE